MAFVHRLGAQLIIRDSVYSFAFAAAEDLSIFPNAVTTPYDIEESSPTEIVVSTAALAGAIRFPALTAANGPGLNGKRVTIWLGTAGHQLTINDQHATQSTVFSVVGDHVTVACVWDAVVGSGAWEIVEGGQSTTFGTTPQVTAYTPVAFS